MKIQEVKSVLNTIELLNKELAKFIYPYLKKEYEKKYEWKATFKVRDIISVSYFKPYKEGPEYINVVFADKEDSVDVININIDNIKDE